MSPHSRPKVLAVIPARAGSKGVPGKNKAVLAGKALVCWAVDVAVESKEQLSADLTIVVSTDDSEIETIVSANYRDSDVTLHRREAGDATATSPIVDTVIDVLDGYERQGTRFDLILLLQPTAPIRTTHEIAKAVSLMTTHSHLQSVVSVTEQGDVHPARMYQVRPGFSAAPLLEPLDPANESMRRQDLEPVFLRNGCIYLARTEAVRRASNMMPHPSGALRMPSSWELNIDEPRDIFVAEALLNAWIRGDLDVE